MITAIAGLTLRGLLGRRRSLLLVFLAILPVVVALLLRLAGRIGPANDRLAEAVLDRLVVTTLLPLVALIFGTAALGAELDDGTAVYLLTKPIARWQVVAAKLLVAAGLTVVLTVPAAFVSGLLLLAGSSDAALAPGYALGTLAGAIAYCSAFLALSLMTGRALAIGLVYMVVWEGVLAGLLAGTRVLSIRQYVLGIAGAIGGSGTPGTTRLDGSTSVLLAAVVVAAGTALAIYRLDRYEVGEAD